MPELTENFESEWLALEDVEQESCLSEAYRLARDPSQPVRVGMTLVQCLRAAMGEVERLSRLDEIDS